MTAGVLIQRRGVTVTVSIDPARLGKPGPDGRYEIELQGYEIVYADKACHEAFAALMFERGISFPQIPPNKSQTLRSLYSPCEEANEEAN